MKPEADSLWCGSFMDSFLFCLFVLAGVPISFASLCFTLSLLKLSSIVGSYTFGSLSHKFGDCNSYTEEHDTTPLLQELLLIIIFKKDFILKFKHADQRVE